MSRRRQRSPWVAVLCLLAACGADDSHKDASADRSEDVANGGEDGSGAGIDAVVPTSDGANDVVVLPAPGRDMLRDILHIDLHLDLAKKTGLAAIRLAATTTTVASFDVSGLKVTSVQQGAVDLNYKVLDGILDVGVPADTKPSTVQVRYSLDTVPAYSMQGWMASGSSLTWPDHCGNLFPCHPDPADGITFDLEVVGLPAGQTAVYAPSIATAAPAYMLAFATGNYSWTSLGQTKAGTEVGFWTTPDLQADSVKGTIGLLAVLEWYEETLGPYPFGKRTGPVSVDWGSFFLGGFESHPYWHVARPVMTDTLIHAHEAAHAWFGDGVRPQCWEDLVLSEGLATYLAGRAVEELQGAQAGKNVFSNYEATLEKLIAKGVDPIANPDSCGALDIEADLLFTKIPYMKGALFLRAAAELVGTEQLEAALSSFYKEKVGKAATMQDLVDHIGQKTQQDLAPLAKTWLKSKGIPSS